MLSLIDRIIEIDKSARERAQNAYNEAGGIRRDAKEELERLKEEYNSRINARLSEVKRQYEAFAAEEISLIEKRESAEKQKLADIMAQNNAAWENEIIGRITENSYEL